MHQLGPTSKVSLQIEISLIFLQDINFSYCQKLTPKALETLSNGPPSDSLQSLNLKSTKITITPNVINNLLKLNRLEELDLCDTGVKPKLVTNFLTVKGPQITKVN